MQCLYLYIFVFKFIVYQNKPTKSCVQVVICYEKQMETGQTCLRGRFYEKYMDLYGYIAIYDHTQVWAWRKRHNQKLTDIFSGPGILNEINVANQNEQTISVEHKILLYKDCSKNKKTTGQAKVTLGVWYINYK